MSVPGQFVGNGIQVYVPLFEFSGRLQLDYSRNANTMRNKLNGYTKQVITKNIQGEYVRWNPAENARFGRKLEWQQNTPRPTGTDNGPAFQVYPFTLTRYADQRVVDTDTIAISNLDIQAQLVNGLAQKMITNRVRKACTEITTTGNYPPSNVKTATALTGGFLHLGTPADPRLMIAIQEAKAIIQLATYGRFNDGELGVLCNPNTARKLARSRELREYMSNQAGSFDWIKMKVKEYNGGYMLPPVVYDTQWIVEDTLYTDDNVNEDGTEAEAASFAFPDNTLLVYARPGDLEAKEGAAGYDGATFTQFVYGANDMALESITDQWNHRLFFGMTDWFATKVTSPLTGVLITNVFS